jgi:hypothetical protein
MGKAKGKQRMVIDKKQLHDDTVATWDRFTRHP